ncbi:hypothetical protein CBR_g26420 [Chara braunii]|uniref:Uncharacterized protein n=1 Tax=Chara braunii TaxID=69332 RepID=A0A388L823_CHABU|nr:hypothetical protein CBR_g26420 [Chara braunii]|eukprot:GBG78392.1 hypothetical protein CBR_g26420 [Chara braunii]
MGICLGWCVIVSTRCNVRNGIAMNWLEWNGLEWNGIDYGESNGLWYGLWDGMDNVWGMDGVQVQLDTGRREQATTYATVRLGRGGEYARVAATGFTSKDRSFKRIKRTIGGKKMRENKEFTVGFQPTFSHSGRRRTGRGSELERFVSRVLSCPDGSNTCDDYFTMLLRAAKSTLTDPLIATEKEQEMDGSRKTCESIFKKRSFSTLQCLHDKSRTPHDKDDSISVPPPSSFCCLWPVAVVQSSSNVSVP